MTTTSSPSNTFTQALEYFTLLSTPTRNTMATAYAPPPAHLGAQTRGNGNDYTEKAASPRSTVSSGSQKVTYEDPDADISLRSSDGRIFKVESYVLKTHRCVFDQPYTFLSTRPLPSLHDGADMQLVLPKPLQNQGSHFRTYPN
jgi:hypothetical protein